MNAQPSRRLAKATVFSPSSQLAGDALEGGALEAPRAGADHQVVEPASRRPGLDQALALGAAEELVDGDVDDAVDRAAPRREGVQVEDAGDVAAALAEEDAGPAGQPPRPHGHLWRAPMRCSSGSRSWEWEPTPQTVSGSAPSASASSCCTCRCTNGYSSCEVAR